MHFYEDLGYGVAENGFRLWRSSHNRTPCISQACIGGIGRRGCCGDRFLWTSPRGIRCVDLYLSCDLVADINFLLYEAPEVGEAMFEFCFRRRRRIFLDTRLSRMAFHAENWEGGSGSSALGPAGVGRGGGFTSLSIFVLSYQRRRGYIVLDYGNWCVERQETTSVFPGSGLSHVVSTRASRFRPTTYVVQLVRSSTFSIRSSSDGSQTTDHPIKPAGSRGFLRAESYTATGVVTQARKESGSAEPPSAASSKLEIPGGKGTGHSSKAFDRHLDSEFSRRGDGESGTHMKGDHSGPSCMHCILLCV